MTVQELIGVLEDFPRSAKLVLSRDAEGNSYSPLEALTTGAYFAETKWNGEFYEDGQDDVPGNDRVLAVCLWPVN